MTPEKHKHDHPQSNEDWIDRSENLLQRGQGDYVSREQRAIALELFLARVVKWATTAVWMLALLTCACSGYFRVGIGDGVNYALEIQQGEVLLQWAPRGGIEGMRPVGVEAEYHPAALRFRGATQTGGTLVRVYAGPDKKMFRNRIPFWLILLLTSVPIALAWYWQWRLARVRSRYVQGLCRCCGYDLRGNESGVCSECGTPISPDLQVRPFAKRPLLLLASYLIPPVPLLLIGFTILSLPPTIPWPMDLRLVICLIPFLGPVAWPLVIPCGMPGLLCVLLCVGVLYSVWLLVILKTRLRYVRYLIHCVLSLLWFVQGCQVAACAMG